MASELIAEAITEHYGERCPEYDADCLCCKAWAEFDRLRHAARPAPAATDTGLVTVGYAHRGTIGLLLEGAVSKAVIIPKAGGDFKTPVMLVEQAEELLAAKEARIKELEEHFAEMTRSCLAERDRNKALQSENKRLREALEPFAGYGEDYFDKDYNGTPLPDEQVVGWVYLNYGHFRKARAVLGGRP